MCSTSVLWLMAALGGGEAKQGGEGERSRTGRHAAVTTLRFSETQLTATRGREPTHGQERAAGKERQRQPRAGCAGCLALQVFLLRS